MLSHPQIVIGEPEGIKWTAYQEQEQGNMKGKHDVVDNPCPGGPEETGRAAAGVNATIEYKD